MRADMIESELFAGSRCDFDSLEPFGFVRDGNGYYYRKDFLGGQFRAEIRIAPSADDCEIRAKVTDLSTGEEYLPLRARHQQGAFVNEVREAYKAVLSQIRDSCFLVQPFFTAERTWIIPVKPDYYDVEQDFQRDGKIRWHRRGSVRVGDTVFMYMSAPVFAVRYQCRVISLIEEPRKEMLLKLEHRFPDSVMPRSRLQSLGVKSVRSARHVPESVIAELVK